jgi:predicted nucleic-acid-binding protein
MLAVDTNLIVRYLTRDDPQQFAQAEAIIEGPEPVFVTLTVVLETEWVLRNSYRYGRARVLDALRAFAGLPNVALEDPTSMSEALDRAEQGKDLADALHLVKAQACAGFITFDQHFVATAAALSPIPVRLP